MEKEITRLDHKAYRGLSNVNQGKFTKAKKYLSQSRNPNEVLATTTTRLKQPDCQTKKISNLVESGEFNQTSYI